MGIVQIKVKGLVQGIGYRPFVAEKAEQLHIRGWVRNTAGIVTVLAEGEKPALKQFLSVLSEEAPVGARIDSIDVTELSEEMGEQEMKGCKESSRNFHIRNSQEEGKLTEVPSVPTDLPTCKNCEKELLDRKNRRYHYPFISCTSCGPRYSIIHQLPYDRENITMGDFGMCKECGDEYVQKGNVRRHAQTIACHACGPKLFFAEIKKTSGEDGESMPVEAENSVYEEAAFERAVQLLKTGGILAIKDIGGYHLACLWDCENTVRELRVLKGREKKPFALMFENVERIRECCEVSDREKALLESDARPIVLLRKKRKALEKADVICGNSPDIGAMLPCNPLQILLVRQVGTLIMTSANPSGEMLVTKNDKMKEWFQRALEQSDISVPLGILGHDRRIITPLDDSIVRVVSGRVQTFRRARGYVPETIEFPWYEQEQALFAGGGDLKSAFAYVKKGKAMLSQHLGDLEDMDCAREYLLQGKHMAELFRLDIKSAVMDAHPGYHVRAFTRQLSANVTKPKEVYHHHAHVASVIAEHQLMGEVLGFAFDGTGYGEGGIIRGSETYYWNGQRMKSVAHLAGVYLPAGDATAKNTKNSLYGYVAGMASEHRALVLQYLRGQKWYEEDAYLLVERAMNLGINRVQTTSMGRLFDAVSALLQICNYNDYEGEAPIELEQMAFRYALEKREQAYPIVLPVVQQDGKLLGDVSSLFGQVVQGIQENISVPQLAYEFILAIAGYVETVCEQFYSANPTVLHQVVLSGGTFQNRILFETVIASLEKKGYHVYSNEIVPTGDGGLCLGQAYLACMQENSSEGEGTEQL